MSTDVVELVSLGEDVWRDLEQRHRERVEPWVAPRRDRRSRGIAHPVDDFLFDYYPYSVGRLSAWHPGHGTTLLGDARQFLASPDYADLGDRGVTTDAGRLGRHTSRLALVERLLSATADREPLLGCFGMHEWAMVYRQSADQVRHNANPLRLTTDEIADAVEATGLRCTHIDAYRFFTPEAVPLNAHTPTRAAQHELEQPGCLHANMDLYKYAQWFSPFVGSDLVADCFELAREARELDMRASPYDLEPLGYAPIRVETANGKREYVGSQARIAERAGCLRDRLLATARTLRAASGDSPDVH